MPAPDIACWACYHVVFSHRVHRLSVGSRTLSQARLGTHLPGGIDGMKQGSTCGLEQKPGSSASSADHRVLAPIASSFLLLVVRPGAPSSILAPSSDALSY